MEGTGSFGAGLLRFLADYGLAVIEVDRPDRSARRRNGKSDPLDAKSAARAVRSYVARRTAEGRTKKEILRCLKRYIAREIFPYLLSSRLTSVGGHRR
jgi:transposase